MASLAGQQIKDKYVSLLKTSDNGDLSGNSGISAVNVTDGLGNASALSLSSNRAGINMTNPAEALDVTGNIKGSGTGVFAGALTCATSLTIGSAAMSEADLESLDGITAGTAAASKALVLDANKDIGTLRNLVINGTFSDGNYTFDTSGNVSGLGTVGCGAITSGGNLAVTGTITGDTSLTLDSTTISTAEMGVLDGVTPGTAAANKAVVLQGSKNIATIGTIGCGAITSTGSSSFATSVMTPKIEFTDGDDAIVIADGGGITSSAGITSTAAANVFGATSFNEANISNVGNIALDTISSDAATSIGVILGTDAGDDFNVGSATMFTVQGDTGFIGIGTSSPAVQLDIENTEGSATDEGGNLRLGSNDGAVMASGHRLGVLEFAGAEDTSSTMTVGARIESVTDAIWSATENGANLNFYTTDGNAIQTQRMTILAAGNIGMGVDDPDAALEILKAGTQFKLSYDATNYANFDVADDGLLTITTVDPDGAEADIALMPDGNVGIGTAAPDGTLHVKTTSGHVDLIIEADANDARLTLDTGADTKASYIYFKDAGDTENVIVSYNEGFGTASLQSSLGFYTDTITDSFASASPKMLINKEGNIGIGTVSFQAASVGYLAIGNGTSPGAHTDNQVYIGARDSAGTGTDTLSTLSIFTEEGVDATALDAVGTLTTRIPIWVNDVCYWLYLDPV
tara:strand:+ start:1820 stop:3886 length:2067 start_codon:yes stop_codon:yes gene_type:complete